MKVKRLNGDGLLAFFSAIVLLIVSSAFGYMSMPTEMGLSVLAGALGLAFSNLDKISEFSGAGFSAKMKDQIQAVVEKETEQDTAEVKPQTLSADNSNVIRALADPKYTWRTLPGICKQTSLSESAAWKVLVSLAKQDLVRVGNNNKTGEMIWALTQTGRTYAHEAA